MKQTLAIVGSQWGDEGKGKITDFFSCEADYIVRWSGGDNAGHTIIFDNKTFKLASAIQTGKRHGMTLLDDHLKSLFNQGIISWEEVKKKAGDSRIGENI